MTDLKVDVTNLKKNYGSNQVLKGIDFKVANNEVVVLIGPSGSGKSTLLRCLNKLEEPTSGSIVIDGHDISDPKTNIDKARENIGMVFQHFNLFNNLSVGENIMLAPVELGKANKDEAMTTAKKLLETVGLADKFDAMPASLSGGQKQRVAIARAIVNHPKILLADEPTGALDSKTSDQLLDIFEQLNQNGQTILMVTHSSLAASRAKRVLFIKDGIVYHQLYRGELDSKAFLEKINMTMASLLPR